MFELPLLMILLRVDLESLFIDLDPTCESWISNAWDLKAERFRKKRSSGLVISKPNDSIYHLAFSVCQDGFCRIFCLDEPFGLGDSGIHFRSKFAWFLAT